MTTILPDPQLQADAEALVEVADSMDAEATDTEVARVRSGSESC